MADGEIRIGIIGLGLRGRSLLKDALQTHGALRVTALCDIDRSKAEEALAELDEREQPVPFLCENYCELLARDDVDVVVIATGWDSHVQIACGAMERGKIVGCEVAGAHSLEECWKLVRTYEKTGTPIMFLENCCYGRDEMMLLNMIGQGVFGELVHFQGGYRHDIRSLCVDTNGSQHFRIRQFAGRCCDYYPTHDLGPIARLLGLGHGNRMESLVSVASKAVGLADYAARHAGADNEIHQTRFRQGDVVTTTIRCSGGETIVLFLDTTLPRFYSRGLQVQGTRGMYCEDNGSILLEGEYDEADGEPWSKQWGNVEKYRERYEHSEWRHFLEEKQEGGHGGMDRLMLEKFFEAIRQGKPMPIDVYDMAEWKAVTVLSEQSILAGGAPQYFPDFRSGSWLAK